MGDTVFLTKESSQSQKTKRVYDTPENIKKKRKMDNYFLDDTETYRPSISEDSYDSVDC